MQTRKVARRTADRALNEARWRMTLSRPFSTLHLPLPCCRCRHRLTSINPVTTAVPLHSNSLTSIQHLVFSPSLHHVPRRHLFGFGKSERVALKERRVVPYSASTFYDVVIDVDSYSSFVPFCSGSRVTRRLSSNELEADLTIGFRIFTEKYTSRIECQRPNYIKIRSVQSSVFGHLVSRWRFIQDRNVQNQCTIEFDVEFEVSSPIHASAVKLFFTDVAERQIKAFSERCRTLAEQAVTTSETVATQPSLQEALPAAHAQLAQAQTPTTPSSPMEPSTTPAATTAAAAAAAFTPTPSATVSSSPTPVSMPPTPIPSSSGASCPVLHLGPRIKFTPSETNKLRIVFEKHAKPMTQHTHNKHPTLAQSTSHSHSSLHHAAPKHEQEFDHENFGKETAWVQSAPTHPSTPLPVSSFPTDASTSAPLSTSSPSFPLEHLVTSSGAELRLDVDGFTGVCRDVCMSAGGVFGKFRERATVRTIADIGSQGLLTRSLFVADPSLYAWFHSASAKEAGVYTHTRHETDIADENVRIPAIHDPEESVAGSADCPSGDSHPTVSVTLPHSFSFGEFLSHFYYLTKATIEEKMLYSALICAKRLELYGESAFNDSQGIHSSSPSPLPDVFSRPLASIPLPISILRARTAAFFTQHLAILRHIMPLMAYHRAREMRQQLEGQRAEAMREQRRRQASPNANLLPPIHTPPPTSIDPAVTVIALLGLLEGVLTEAENGISELIQRISSNATAATATATATSGDVTAASPSSPASSPSHSIPTMLIDEWTYRWTQEGELLALASVPGLATLIQIHSVLPTQEDNKRKQQTSMQG